MHMEEHDSIKFGLKLAVLINYLVVSVDLKMDSTNSHLYICIMYLQGK